MRYVHLSVLTVCVFVIIASCVLSCIDAATQLPMLPYFMGAMWLGLFEMVSYIDVVAEDNARAELAAKATATA